ncbi:phasin [Cupriavidus sp. UYMU48A]|nr:phasin [Cupriavidus sp. UYMU48A]
MSAFTPDQFAALHKTNLTNLAMVSKSTIDGFQKLTELNLRTARSALTEGQENLNAVLAGKDPREAVAVQGNLAQPAAEKAISYARQVCEIAAQAQAELARAVEEQYEQHHRNMQAFVDTFVKNAPAGSEAVSALLQSTIDAAGNTYRSAQAVSRQMAEIARGNLAAGAGKDSGAKA